MNDYKIKELYEKMEMDLIDSMKRNLSRHLAEEEEVGFKYTQWQAEKLKELKRFQRENKKIIGGYVKGLNKEVSKHLQEELKQGSISAIKHYNKVLGDNKNPSKLMNRSFFRTNDRKVKALIKAVNNDLNKANIGALRMINDEYRQIIHKSAFFVANGVKTEKQATSMAIKEISEKKATMQACDEVSKSFLAGGLNCIEYSNGRKVNIASYAAMAVRTASIRAHLMGEGDFRKSIGRTLIKVSTHGGTCKLCARWQGRVLIDDVYSGGEPDGKHTLLSEAMEQGLFHPNCRHGIFTYYPELEGISYDEDEGDEFLPDDLKSQYNYYNRLGKSWNRRSRGFIDPDNKKDARKNYLACEKKKEEIIRINAESYNNVTKEWLDNKDGVGKIGYAKKVKAKNGKTYHYNKRTNYFDHGEEENNGAKVIIKNFGGRIKHNFVVNEEKKIRIADYTYTNERLDIFDELIELKTPIGEKHTTIYNRINNSKDQADRFMIDIQKMDMFTDEENIADIEDVMRRKKWIKSIIITKEEKVLKVISR